MTTLPPSQSAATRAARRILGSDGALVRRIEQWFATRGARRRLVVAWSVALVATAVLPLAMRLQDTLGPALVIGGIGMGLVAEPFLGFFVASALGWILRTAVRRVADLPDEDIDERQVALRDRTYLVAYRVLSVSVAWLLLAAYIVTDASATRVVSSAVAEWVMSDALFVIFPLVLFLPSAVLAWYSDDEHDEHDEEPEGGA
jgi:phosphate/sulfate permease